MADLVRSSALKGVHWHGDGLAFAEAPHSGKLLLRGQIDDAAAHRLEAILGCRLPDAVGRFAGDDPAVALLAPSRWLVLTNAGVAAAFYARLAAAAEGSGAAVSDVSDGLTEIAIEGPRARDLLASATPLDLRASSFPPGSFAQTQFARTSCVVRCRSDDRFDIFVDTSQSHYVLSWLRRHGPLVTAIG